MFVVVFLQYCLVFIYDFTLRPDLLNSIQMYVRLLSFGQSRARHKISSKERLIHKILSFHTRSMISEHDLLGMYPISFHTDI